MKFTTTLLFYLILLLSTPVLGQTQFWVDDFEDVGSPSSGTRTPSNEGGVGIPSTVYFSRTNNAGISLIFGSYTGFSGSKFWAAENNDAVFGAGQEEQNIVFSTNISGKSGLSFQGLFAANNLSAPFETAALGFSHSDYMIVEYRIDGGPYQPLIRFFGNNAITSGVNNKSLAEDTNSDDIGDGTILTTNFQNFTKPIAGTGTTLDLRIRCYTNGGNEEMAFDNFRLFETVSCTAPTVNANPPNRAICSGGNTTFSIAASGATAYQWQVNTGSGFTNIANGGVYSGATTNTLTITGAVPGMNGYLYRCVAINGVGTCFANSNSATLTVSNVSTAGAQSNISCFGGSNGSAIVVASGGISPYSYSWSPSGGTGSIATGLSVGTYTVTVTDNIGCQATRQFTITQPSTLNANITAQTNIACNGAANGSATVTASGGAGSYTYSWSPSGGTAATASGLSAGTYTVTVTDNNGCGRTAQAFITQPTALSATTSQNNVSSNGGNDGSATVNVSGGAGGYTYSWSPSGGTAATASNLTAGDYTVTITDINSCQITRDFTITEPGITTPTLTTTAASDITATTATLGGEVTDNGGALVTERGIVYNTSGTPNVDDDTKVTIGSGDGSFSDEITGLTAGTQYYVRAYATNSEGTSYGSEESFTTLVACPNVTTADVAVNQEEDIAVGLCEHTFTWTEPTFIGCGITVTRTLDPVSAVSDPYVAGQTVSATVGVGVTTVTYEAEDNLGNTETFVFTLTANDVEDPEITCVSDITVDADADECTYTHNGTAWDATADDNCSVASVGYVLTGVTTGSGTSLDGVTFNLGVTTVTWTATDGSGNTSACSFDVTVEDNEDPTITAPANIIIDTDTDVCFATNVDLGDPIVADNCESVLIQWNMENGAVNDVTVIPSYTESIVTSALLSGGQKVESIAGSKVYMTRWFGSISKPVFAMNLTEGVFVNTFSFVHRHNHNPGFPTNPSYFAQLQVDAGGTGNYVDIGDPVLLSPATVGNVDVIDLGIYLPEGNNNFRFNAVGLNSGTNTGTEFFSVDNVTITYALIVNNDAPTTFPVGDTTVTWTVTDSGGNTATDTQTVTVIDNQNPVVLNEASLEDGFGVSTDTEACTYTHNGTAWDVAVDDNCDIDTVEWELTGATGDTGENSLDGIAFNQGITTVTWTITDINSNFITFAYDVEVEDNQNPEIICIVTDQTIEECSYTHLGTDWDVIATDNCSVASVEYVLTGVTSGSGTSLVGVVFNFGVTTVTWTVTDGSGNINECSFMVNVYNLDCIPRKLIKIAPDTTAEIIKIIIPPGIIVNEVVLKNDVGVDTGIPFDGVEMDMSSLSEGMYFLTVDTNIGVVNQTIAKM